MKSLVGMSPSQAFNLAHRITTNYPKLRADVHTIGNGEHVVTLSRYGHRFHKSVLSVYYYLWGPEDLQKFIEERGVPS